MTPRQPVSLPVLGIQPGAAILSGWLLVNLWLLAPLFEARWDGSAPPSGDRLRDMLSVLGLAAFVVAWFMKDAAAFWFGVLAVGVQGSAWLPGPPTGPWNAAFPGLLALWQIPLFFFVRSSAAAAARTLRWIVPLVVGAEALVALFMPPAWLDGWRVAVAGLWLLQGLWMVGVLLVPRREAGVDLARQLLALSVLLVVLAVAAQIMSWRGAGAIFGGWVPAAGLVLAVSQLLGLVLRLIVAEGQGRAAQAELAERLASERAELVASFALRQQLQASEVQARERARIRRELHDGLGAHLVAASVLLSTSRPAHQAVADLIGLCLQELRSSIDTLGADFHDVGELLGAFRDRMEPVLEARGMALDWQVQPLRATARLQAGERLQVMRIVQEAFTNILKHSGASQVILRAETQASGCSVIDIIDNGGGLGPGAALAPGWGLSHMQERAALLGAQLDCTRGEAGGVHVRLALNCGPSEASPAPPA